MDLQPHTQPELTLVSMTNSRFGSAPYSGGFFPGAAGFTIDGGIFTSNITNNVYNPLMEEQPSAFRTILLGDIKLMKEIRSNDKLGAVRRRSRGASVRRMYSAKLVGGQTGPITVATYQGGSAEEEWRQLVGKYEAIRHPNIMQLYGLVCTKGLRAMIFYDDLIPFRQFLNRFQNSPILTTYINGYCSSEWHEAMQYCCSIDINTEYFSSTVWIRSATGELCVDLVRDHETAFLPAPSAESKVPRIENVSLDDPYAEDVAISTLNERSYHSLCSRPPIAKLHLFAVPTQLPMKPEMIFLGSNFKRGTLFKITEPLAVNHVDLGHWITLAQEQKGELLTNSWIRFDSRRARMLFLAINMHRVPTPWLAQANHIFTQFHTTSQLEDYVCVTEITFILRCLPNTHNTQGPEGYLFVCPPENFRTGADSFQWPNCPAYWSHDPSGTARLSTEDAKAFGFPVIHIETRVYGCSWDARVYEGLRRFHRGRGFDPDSQEVAIHLGYPLYKLSSVVTRFECVD